MSEHILTLENGLRYLSVGKKEEQGILPRRRTVHHPQEENLQMLDLPSPGSEKGSPSSEIYNEKRSILTSIKLLMWKYIGILE